MSGRRIIQSHNLSVAFFLAEFRLSVYAMSQSDHSATISVESFGAELEPAMPRRSNPKRRTLILTVLATGVRTAACRSAAADEDQPGSAERPQKADVLVFSEGEHAGEIIKLQDLKLGGPPVSAGRGIQKLRWSARVRG